MYKIKVCPIKNPKRRKKIEPPSKGDSLYKIMPINTKGSMPSITTYRPDTLFLEEGIEEYPLAQEILSRLPGVPRQGFQDISTLTEQMKSSQYDVFGEGKNSLALSRFKGSFLKKCPGISPGMVCCNYYVVNLSKNCIYDCSYCFLQDFLENNPMQVAYVNVEDLISELEEVFTQYPDRNFRVGTGELTDSLALDTIAPYTNYLLPFFNQAVERGAGVKDKIRSDYKPIKPFRPYKYYCVLVTEPTNHYGVGRKRHTKLNPTS